MKLGAMGAAGRDLRSLFDGGSTAGLGDGPLLARFAAGPGDPSGQSAFAALVARHGPMVWGTCRRILRDGHSAEDAFQATFLILARKAGSVRVDDSVGRWLHGVAIRVAIRARSSRRAVGGDPSTLESLAGPPSDPDLADLRAIIDEEVGRLPAPYRAVVVLCHLEGLTRDRAATRLGCPVGTVNSRLSRAADLLRSRLTRRGLGPSAGGLTAWMAMEGTAGASTTVPPRLAEATASASARFASGVALAGTVSASVVGLIESSFRGAMMTKAAMISLLLAGLGLMLNGPTQADPRATEGPRTPAATAARTPEPPPPPPSLDDRVKALNAEWAAARDKYNEAQGRARTDAEKAEAAKLAPDVVRFGERFTALAGSDPRLPAARDALLWIIDQYWIVDIGGLSPWGKLVDRAMDRLVEDHPDDFIVAWACLGLDHVPTPARDRFVSAIYEQARSKRTRGVAALALARYRWKSAEGAYGRPHPGRPTVTDGEGHFATLSPEHEAYLKAGFERDPVPIKAEAVRLLEEVIRDHDDEPYDPARKLTLGAKARELRDGWLNLAESKPAPDFEGKDFDGKPLKLADHRGKVVALVFWSTWCGPCMKEIPRERALAERLAGRPFTLLGVNCDADPEAAREAIRAERIIWPNFADGAKAEGPCVGDYGPIANRYHVERLPAVFLIDAKGTIRRKMQLGEGLDKAVDELLAEIGPAK